MAKIYVASSWRNDQPIVVQRLRELGHEVYDFRHPAPGDHGFTWSAIDPYWKSWTPEQYRHVLTHRLAERGYSHDLGAMKAADYCVLVLPSGRSASFELGWCMGAGKRGVLFMPEPCEPELMYREATIYTTWPELVRAFSRCNRCGHLGDEHAPMGCTQDCPCMITDEGIDLDAGGKAVR